MLCVYFSLTYKVSYLSMLCRWECPGLMLVFFEIHISYRQILRPLSATRGVIVFPGRDE